MGCAVDTFNDEQNLRSTYVKCCNNLPDDKMVIIVGSQRVEGASDLFYAPVSIKGQSTLRGMLDSGSMSCTLSVEAEPRLRAAGFTFNSTARAGEHRPSWLSWPYNSAKMYL